MTSRFKLVAFTLLLVPACNKERASSGESASGETPSGAKGPAMPAAAANPGTTPPSAATAAEAKPAAPSSGTGVTSATVIEAGCSYDARQLKGNAGDLFRVSCPAGCEKGPMWGTGVYTYDSSICRSGIHAGAIPAEGGTVTVRLEPGRPAYRGSTQNGIKSSDYNESAKSYAVVLSGESAAAAPTAAAAAAGSADKSVIEAGCTFDARRLKGNDGDLFKVSCPAGCEKGPTWGTGVYTADSSICRSGIHAGAIPAEGGTVTVRLEPGRPAYRGSTQNGIKSSDYHESAKSYAVVLSGAPAAAAAAGSADKSVIEAGCTFDARRLKGNDGDLFKVSCPAGCETGPTWGTGVYTADSSICRSGIHAGAIPAEGGTVTVRLEPGRPAYRGSTQNGIKSSDYNESAKSYAVVVDGAPKK